MHVSGADREGSPSTSPPTVNTALLVPNTTGSAEAAAKAFCPPTESRLRNIDGRGW